MLGISCYYIIVIVVVLLLVMSSRNLYVAHDNSET